MRSNTSKIGDSKLGRSGERTLRNSWNRLLPQGRLPWDGRSLTVDNQEQYGTINAYMGPDGLDGQADFVLYHAVVDNVFVSGNENYMHLDYWTNRSQDQYSMVRSWCPMSVVMTFLD